MVLVVIVTVVAIVVGSLLGMLVLDFLDFSTLFSTNRMKWILTIKQRTGQQLITVLTKRKCIYLHWNLLQIFSENYLLSLCNQNISWYSLYFTDVTAHAPVLYHGHWYPQCWKQTPYTLLSYPHRCLYFKQYHGLLDLVLNNTTWSSYIHAFAHNNVSSPYQNMIWYPVWLWFPLFPSNQIMISYTSWWWISFLIPQLNVSCYINFIPISLFNRILLP